LAKVFQEKDIPIQVAVGNYDLGICGLDWVEELLAKYPSSALIKLRNLSYGEGSLYMVASSLEETNGLEEMQTKKEIIRLASEYPNLAESFALNRRLRRFSIFPLWGAAEAYPPESAELALIPGTRDKPSSNHDLVPVSNVLDFSAYMIANKESWERKDLSQMLASIDDNLPAAKGALPSVNERGKTFGGYPSVELAEDTVRLALPDGHQQSPTLDLLYAAGIKVQDYPSATGNRRPKVDLSGVTAKVIRPQDMPLQVANGNFDLAITGADWLREQFYQFPSSPITELLDLKIGRVRIVAVVSKELSVDDIEGLKRLYSQRATSLRVASEYVNIADKYARDNHLGMYRIIPTWGASEAFLPEDADLLIENTQTGHTITRHNLKIIDTLFESAGCLIGNKDSIISSAKRDRIEHIVSALQRAT
jgi:ATP phosphoribosyltransferase